MFQKLPLRNAFEFRFFRQPTSRIPILSCEIKIRFSLKMTSAFQLDTYKIINSNLIQLIRSTLN